MATTSGERAAGRRGSVPGPGLTLGLATVPLVVLPVGVLAGQAAQPVADPWSASLSALAGPGAADRWIVTTTLALLGACHVLVAVGLRRVPTIARVLLGTGGALLVVVAAVPQPDEESWFTVHIVAGALAWTASATWPAALAASGAVPRGLRVTSAAAVVVVGTPVVWFAVELIAGGAGYGTSQRVALAALTVWPVVVAAHAVRRTTADEATAAT